MGALFERIAHLEKLLAESRASAPARATAEEKLALLTQLSALEASWRERRATLRAKTDRRRRRVRAASTVLFFVMCAGAIATMALGQVPFGLFFFLASVTGWALAGLQNGRQEVLLEAYERDGLRLERALTYVRRALPRLRVEVTEPVEAAPEEIDPLVEADLELAQRIDPLAR